MTELDTLAATPRIRAARNADLLHAFYHVATRAYLNNWGRSFHLPPFHGEHDLAQACTAQEQSLARNFGAGQHILDLGCGVGGPARTVARSTGCRITAVNIIGEQIAIAEEATRDAGLAGAITYVKAHFSHLPFPDGSFDGAYTFDALCHSPDKAETYREIHRVLKPGATFAGTDWMHADWLPPVQYAKWIEPVCRFAALPDLLSPAHVAEFLRRAGFVVADVHDVATEGDMAPNWDLFDEAASSIAGRPGDAYRFMYQHCVTTAAAGRTGAFIIGAWKASA